MDPQKKQIDIIRDKCKDAGLSIYKVFMKAQVPIPTIQNWDRKEPSAFDVVYKIDKAIKELIEETEKTEI